ncbi:transcription termination/antitermination protein NusG [Sedimentisphaera salicampi]|uniref:Transcription termination/antitermination protein NusG n=1 Tax=Sedimentisphaera salicampi TaxID=1941349 RepID=A0A1W6LLD1_9BACT|nr:transcription termination/antitermination protein NusG [Sedimentisphaera salicampi]ARN56600.1 Transcription termination/antitermination protein NusG [Sedimentisphaera salicampi]OXU15487.1 Transcription termination/antitermination protein NusG [Sedimentisphaera salicampi]
MQWYVLRVASNKENYVRDTIEKKVKLEHLEEYVGRVVVPTERKRERTKEGKDRIKNQKLYPGYVFMELETDENGRIPEKPWFLIKETGGVGDFIGTEGVPTPMRDTEVAKMLQEVEKQETEEEPVFKLEFNVGDPVKIIDGAFENTEGVVDSVDTERGVVRVIANVFGRSTPIEIEYWQLEKG